METSSVSQNLFSRSSEVGVGLNTLTDDVAELDVDGSHPKIAQPYTVLIATGSEGAPRLNSGMMMSCSASFPIRRSILPG